MYSDEDIYAIRIVALETRSHRSYGDDAGDYFRNHSNERVRILGEIPVRKYDDEGKVITDPDGNADTSFLAKIPADVPFTFQTIDKHGMVLNASQTWHQVRPGEARYDCGGCHAHAKTPTSFFDTAASKSSYQVRDLTRKTPLLSKDDQGETVVVEKEERAVDVEYYEDVKPILEESCTQCHTAGHGGGPPRDLVLDADNTIDGYPETYHRLANDGDAQWGIPPLVRVGDNPRWRQTNASRYVRKFQSRRSLLIWKVFGERLDGWTNDDHPSASTPGDPSSLPADVSPNASDLDYTGAMMPPPDSNAPPLTADEKMTLARWIDLGCAISSPEAEENGYGWFLDNDRPTLFLSAPRTGEVDGPLEKLRFGAFDYYTALDEERMSVTADFEVNGTPAGEELIGQFEETGDRIWTLSLDSPIEELEEGRVTVVVYDNEGNRSEVRRMFTVE